MMGTQDLLLFIEFYVVFFVVVLVLFCLISCLFFEGESCLETDKTKSLLNCSCEEMTTFHEVG